LVLDTLRPHLVQLWRNAAARQRESRSLAALTPREREILLWVARGKSNREIAALLYLAPGTIRKHLDNVYDKLGVSNRAGAVGHALIIDDVGWAASEDDRELVRAEVMSAIDEQVAAVVLFWGDPTPYVEAASGGIGDGTGVARAIGLGAQGVSLGTRFVASEESRAH